jgi:hypothetical protein
MPRFALHHSVSPFGHAECPSEEDNQSREQKRGDCYHNAAASLFSQWNQSVTPLERSPIERWDGEGLRFGGSASLKVALRWLERFLMFRDHRVDGRRVGSLG